MEQSRRPLDGIRIVDFTWVLAGPFGMRLLADFGAEVIKIQQPRSSGGVAPARYGPGYFNTYNRNKLGISLNLSKPEGVAIAKKLIEISDGVVENFTPRVMKNWGLEYKDLMLIKPDIIMVSMSGMGHGGPWQEYASYGPTVQALCGITHLTTFPGLLPLGLGYSYSDHVAGLTATIIFLAALEYRKRTGKGQYIEFSQLEGMCALMGPALLDYIVNGRVAIPEGNRSTYPPAAPHSAYRCKGNDRWCTIAIFTEEEWQCFCQLLGNPSWTKEKRFSTLQQRVKNADELDKLVAEWTAKHSAEEVTALLQEAHIAAGIVQDGRDLNEHDPQLRQRGFFVEAIHSDMGKTKFDGTPIKLSRTPATFDRAAPTLGQNNYYVYHKLLGMSEAEIEKYTEQGVL